MKDSLNLTQNISNIAFLIIIYFCILVLTSIIKSNILLDILPSELVNTARVSSYTSIIISSLISSIVIALIISSLFFINIIFQFDIDEKYLVTSYYNSIAVFIIFEIIKFLFAYFTLENELSNITFSDNFFIEIKQTNWYYIDNILKYIMIFISAVAYSITLIYKQEDIKFYLLLIVTIILLGGLYISTIDLFAKL